MQMRSQELTEAAESSEHRREQDTRDERHAACKPLPHFDFIRALFAACFVHVSWLSCCKPDSLLPDTMVSHHLSPDKELLAFSRTHAVCDKRGKKGQAVCSCERSTWQKEHLFSLHSLLLFSL